MNEYQLTIIEKDEIHIPAIVRFAKQYGATYTSIETKDGIVFSFDFPLYNQMKNFIGTLDTLTPHLF